MKKLIFFLLTSLISIDYLNSIELMDEEFLIRYGNPQAPLKVVEFFSFSCPHCLSVFKDFSKIKKEFIDEELMYFTFQAVPKDITTIRALHCLSLLSNQEKQIFLEGLFEYLCENKEDADQLCKAMQDFLTCFSKQKLEIENSEYLKKSPIMQKAFAFVTQEGQVKALPTAEINGFLFPKEVPSYSFFLEAVNNTIREAK